MNGVFLFEISFFISEILTFFYYANQFSRKKFSCHIHFKEEGLFCQHNQPLGVWKNRQFLKSKQKQLKKRENKPNACVTLTSKKLKLLYKKGFRWCKERGDMLCLGDLKLHITLSGVEYSELMKSRQKLQLGSDYNNVRALLSKMFCDRRIWKRSSCGFQFVCKEQTWENEGRNQNDRLQNHRGRKKLIQTLSEHEIPPTQIAQLSAGIRLWRAEKTTALFQRNNRCTRQNCYWWLVPQLRPRLNLLKLLCLPPTLRIPVSSPRNCSAGGAILKVVIFSFRSTH